LETAVKVDIGHDPLRTPRGQAAFAATPIAYVGTMPVVQFPLKGIVYDSSLH
jgi:hypothetical protein